ncbi:MAG TPA: DUF3108 domain-containing protein [Geobacteraceae bacterium]|nr:DUF3108 domain-containing protein [Geobacteraceae bacterium]
MKKCFFSSASFPFSIAGTLMGQLSLALLLGLIAMTTTASALTVPEKLVYDMTWTGIKAGTATQEIIDEGDSIRIVSIARSADWISVFFPVEDRVESLLAKVPPPQLGLPRDFRMKVREGKHRRDKEIIFDHDKGKARYIDHLNGEKVELEIGKNTYDPYSSFYYVRTLPLEVGKSVFVSLLDNKQLWNVEIQVLKKEKLDTILGKINTILIKPLMKSEGIFQKKGEIYIWLTDDARHIPVKMKTKVAIGSITATLVGGKF